MNTLCSFRRILFTSRVLLVVFLLCTLFLGGVHPTHASTQIDITGPPGSVKFGTSVTVLPNGNFVVTDPNFNGGIAVDAGVVYLYDGDTLALISTLTGISTGDRIGSGGVTVLSNGNYVIKSPYWDNGAAIDAGAVTWGKKDTGVNGVVSAANSLVGTMNNNSVGSGGVVALKTGNYVVVSPYWDNPIIPDAGAVTWGRGATSSHGAVSAANSLVGTFPGDRIGLNGVTALTNGNYVVCSPYWDNGGMADVGAATWGDGLYGTTGLVSASISMVGSAINDMVGWNAIALSKGNYLVGSPSWNKVAVVDAGAATWGDGTIGTSGPLSAANSLVGSHTGDNVGQALFALPSGHYVVSSPNWDNGGLADAGAVSWGDGAVGSPGTVSAANSLVGSKANDLVGVSGVTALANGNYVVLSPLWDNGANSNVGAATWGDGASGTTGAISTANSLVGSKNNDQVGTNATALTNGHYVVGSPYWNKGLVSDVGAATRVNGGSIFAGAVSTTNSLVGSKTNDRIGSLGVTALSNGNYVVVSPFWDNGSATNAGAVTWGNGVSGTNGSVTSSNSLVGGLANDYVGHYGVVALANGNYVVPSPDWSDGGVTNAGAVTWGSGITGAQGLISSSNSVVGDSIGDKVGSGFVTALSNGNYVVRSPLWDSSSGTTDAGAVTWGWGAGGTIGAITLQNSVIGTATNGGSTMVSAYDALNTQLVVGRPADNIVTLFQIDSLFLPLIKTQ